MPHVRLFAIKASRPLQAVHSMVPTELSAILKDSAKVEQYQIIGMYYVAHRSCAYGVADVRESDELTIASIKGNIIHMPLSGASSWPRELQASDKLDNTKPTVVLCHHGVRSMRAAMFLESLGEWASSCLYICPLIVSLAIGFEELYNLEGGIHRYAVEVDNSIQIY